MTPTTAATAAAAAATPTTAPLFRPRISSDDLRALLNSASQTHQSYRNGSLLLNKSSTSLPDCSTSCSTPPLHPRRPRLALRLKTKIIDSVKANRLTIIVGPTGSGKSTQVPPVLLELQGAVLCTQPRRLAVVAISKRVASELSVELGGNKVGFHVGNNNLSTHQTQLLFTTAGILLEELRTNGSEALSRFRVLVIDECHERSPESDLILSLVKKYLQNHPKSQLRLVLMSATFPHARYRQYFRDVPGCEDVDTITLESQMTQTSQVETLYLDDILPHLPNNHRDFGRQMRLNPDKDLQKVLSDNMLSLIKSLVIWLDRTEAQIAPFLIFAPTYRHLEQLHDTLNEVRALQISVLHSSIDMEDCLRSMEADTETTGKRRILLASAIADSSVTVPGVSCVVDMCRSLEVRWKGSHVAQTVWACKSICDQRRGRTGRTCPGRCFRLLHKGFYLSRLSQWDIPQLNLSSCLNEVLGLVCSKPDLVESDPRAVLENCLDPPDPQIVEGAIQYLEEMGAVQKSEIVLSPSSPEDRKVFPTQYGEIVAALPLNVADAKVVLAGGQLGLLHETLALRAIYNHKPAPISHKFGSPKENTEVLEVFYAKATRDQGYYLANLAAYMFWDYEWNTRRRKQANVEFWNLTSSIDASEGKDALEWESSGVWKWTPELEEEHSQWCKMHDINPTSVRSIAEIVENTMNALFLVKFEPEWLRCADPTPVWKRPRDWHGMAGECRDMLYRVYDDVSTLCNTLVALLENRLSVASSLVSQRRLKSYPGNSNLACIHFLQGTCNYEDRCRNSHHPDAKRPPCRFYSTGSCSKGKDCLYSHADDEELSDSVYCAPVGGELLIAKLPFLPYLSIEGGPVAWFQHFHPRILMLGEGNFKFTNALTQMGMPPFMSSTNTTNATAPCLPSVDATRLHIDERVVSQVGRLDTFAWNFPYTGHDEDPIIHEALMLETFHSMALLLSNSDLEYFTFAVALQANQFSRWNMVQCAWRTGWRLKGWSTFDNCEFPGYFPSRHAGESFPAEDARLYVFYLNRSDC